MTTTDVYATVFEVRGIGVLLGGYSSIAAAQTKLATAQTAFARFGPGFLPIAVNWQNIASAAGMAARQMVYAGIVLGGMGVIVSKVISVYAAFGKEIMNIRDLTGSSAREAVQAATLFRVAGVSDMQAVRDMLRLSSDVFRNGGQGALGMLGIAATPNTSGIKLFNQIADSLERMPASLHKTMIEEQIFGMRGVSALQPLLRLTKEQRAAAMELANSFDTEALPAIQALQAGAAILGMTLEMKVIFPLANRLMPIALRVVGVLGWLVKAFEKVDTALGRFPSWLITVVGMATAFGAIAVAVRSAWAAIIILNKALFITVLRMIAILAFSGPKGWAMLAAGALALGGAAWALNASAGDKEDKSDKAVDKLGDAADRIYDASTMFYDAFGKYNRGGIPSGLGSADINSLQRAQALGAIG